MKAEELKVGATVYFQVRKRGNPWVYSGVITGIKTKDDEVEVEIVTDFERFVRKPDQCHKYFQSAYGGLT